MKIFQTPGIMEDWRTPINVANLVTFTTTNGRVYGNFERPLTVTSPPFVTTFPKLTREEVDRSQEKGIRVTNYEADITMKGAKDTHVNFKSAMDDLDGLLLAHVVSNDNNGMTAQQAQYMLKPLFKTRRSTRTGRDYPEGMTCRSKVGSADFPRFHVVDSANKPYLADIVPSDIIRVQLSYRGPYVIRNSCFGSSWELTGLQFCGKHEEPPPAFHPVDPTEFPSLTQ